MGHRMSVGVPREDLGEVMTGQSPGGPGDLVWHYKSQETPGLSSQLSLRAHWLPTWLFTHAPAHTCHRDCLQAKEYALIPLIHSIWWQRHTAAVCGSTSKQITVKLCPTPAFNQIQSSNVWHSKERINIKHRMHDWGPSTKCRGEQLISLEASVCYLCRPELRQLKLYTKNVCCSKFQLVT